MLRVHHHPLGHKAELSLRATFPLLGVPVEIRTNSADVIAASEQAFGAWRDLPPDLITRGEPAIVSVVVHSVAPELVEKGPRAFVHRVHGRCFVASDGVNLLTAQIDQGRALTF